MADIPADPDLVLFVTNLLRSQPVRDIDFRFGNLHVRNLNRIADLIDQNRIDMQVRRAWTRDHAAYYPGSNLFLFGSQNMDSNVGRVTIVHEAIHAHFDFHQTAGNGLGEEAAARVGERIFADNAGLRYSIRNSPIGFAALQLVRNMRGNQISPDEYQALWRAIAAHQSYRVFRTDSIDNDGI